jgi:hypothetical protein
MVKVDRPGVDLLHMHRLPILGFIMVVGLAVPACGATLVTQTSPTVGAASPDRTTTTSATAVVSNEQLAQTQASQLAASEKQYATCYTYAALNQGLAGYSVPVGTSVVQSCATTGLTTVEVQQIQGLIKEAS